MPFLSGGVIATAQEVNRFAQNAGIGGAANAGGGQGSDAPADELGIAPSSYGCGKRDVNPQTGKLNGNSGNVRVNQGCSDAVQRRP